MVSTATTKISILLFYRRLAEGSISIRFLYTVYAAIAFVVIYFIVFWVNLFTGCKPFYAFWMQVDLVWAAKNADNYHCFDELKNMIIAAAVSVVQDFIACGLPMILFWKLKVPRRQKIALGAIFGVGFLYVMAPSALSPLTGTACASAACFASRRPSRSTPRRTT
jgi:hypothetical protein